MFEGKKRVSITNPNEITKSEFDALNDLHNFDIFSKEQYAMSLAGIQGFIKKGETEELSQDEVTSIHEGVAELKNLTKYTINEMVDGRIVKSDVFVQEKQVNWHDVLEKSETGEKIERGTFLDTDLNRNLNRVGQTFEKGKGKIDKEKDKDKEEKVDDAMYKAAYAMVKKGDDKKAIYKALKEKDKDGDDSVLKSSINKAYKQMADGYLKKAEDSMDEDDSEDKEDKGKEEKGKKK